MGFCDKSWRNYVEELLVVVVIVVVAFERLCVEILMQLAFEPEDTLASFPHPSHQRNTRMHPFPFVGYPFTLYHHARKMIRRAKILYCKHSATLTGQERQGYVQLKVS